MEALVNCKLYVDGYDLSGDHNALAMLPEIEPLDATAFGMGTRKHIAGLKTLTFNHQGIWNAGTGAVEDVLHGDLGVVNKPMTIAPKTGAEGEVAYFLRSHISAYRPGASIGELFAFSVEGEVSDSVGVIRGTVLGTGAKTATGDGTAYQLGAVASGESLYAVMHVTAVSGTNPTLDVILESDDAEGFPSGTTRITFTQATAIGSEWATPVAGPITDDWWRLSYTIGGTDTPTFTVAIIVGIQ